jgi:hypothetical protein
VGFSYGWGRAAPGGGDVQAPAMMISRIHFSGDMLARVDWTLLVKRWPIVEARLASSSIAVVGGGLVGGAGSGVNRWEMLREGWSSEVSGRGLFGAAVEGEKSECAKSSL